MTEPETSPNKNKPRIVWVGTGFARVDEVAFTGALDLSPYLRVLPADLTCFRPLLSALGVRETFAPRDYVGVMRRLASDHEKEGGEGGEGGGAPVRGKALDVALWVLGALADGPRREWADASYDDDEEEEVPNDASSSSKKKKGDFGFRASTDLPAPDAEGVLRPVSALRFHDAPWLAPPPGTTLTHPKIPQSTAEAIGVRSLRASLLAASSEELGVDADARGLLMSDGAAEAFGQHEALTTRLRHILDAYADGPGIVSELVQNADDAGATEVRLMLDACATRGTKSLLAPGMAAWQGPALVAWNDATFAPSDFRAIARIGQDGKVDRPEAAGRFGLGFNAVYHFTDVPSFVSGEFLVMFDPHATHLPGATPARPGLKIQFAKGDLLAQFPDQFAPYADVFGCDLKTKYDATMFRFPLRTEASAKTSEIKPEAYTADAVRRLFAAFKDRAAETLLFLKHVRKIGVYERRSERGAPELLYEARASGFEGGADPRRSVLRWVGGGEGGGGKADRKAFLAKLRSTPDANLPSSVGWMDLELETSRDPREEPTKEGTHEGGTDGAEGNTHASLPSEKRSVVVAERWMVCSSLAGGDVKTLALSDVGETRGLVPWVGVAARAPFNRTPTLDTTEGAVETLAPGDDGSGSGSVPGPRSEGLRGRAFCFLPLPVLTGLPVHVNATFELSSNRRDVWRPEDAAGGGAARGEWNEKLLADAVAPAYARLVVHAAKTLEYAPDAYFSLFPTSEPRRPGGGANGDEGGGVVAKPWSLVLKPLYAALAAAKTVRAADPKSAHALADGGEERRGEERRGGEQPRRFGGVERLGVVGDAPRRLAWVAPADPDAFFPPTAKPRPAPRTRGGAPGGPPETAAVLPPALAAALRAFGAKIIEGVPAGVRAAFAAHAPAGSAKTLSPGTVRAMVRAKTKRGPSSFKSLPREHALALLAYALEDAEAKDADADAIAELRGLPLVPLADGSLGAFSEGGCISPDPDGRKTGPDGSAAAAAACLHLSTDDEEARLLASLPGARGSLVDRFALATVPGLLDKMDALARGAAGRALGVRAVDAAALAALFLPNAMPRAWSTTRRGEAMERWCPPRDGIATPEKSTDEEHPTSAQLATLWRRLATLAPTPELMAPFEGAPLLPVDDGAVLAPLMPRGAVVRGREWSESASGRWRR